MHSARHGCARNLKLHTLIELVMSYKSAKFHEDWSKNEPTANIFVREILHVHSARHGRASNLKLSTLIELVMNNKSAKFGED